MFFELSVSNKAQTGPCSTIYLSKNFKLFGNAVEHKSSYIREEIIACVFQATNLNCLKFEIHVFKNVVCFQYNKFD